jgi:hypothetical protein
MADYDFDFIADLQFRAILKRDFDELQKCIDNNLSKSALILSGSIIETILVEYFTHYLPKGKTIAQILKMDLDNLIIEAHSIKLISNNSKDLCAVVKNYRNLIHPGREIRKNEDFDSETANVSFNLVKIILKELRKNYIQKYGYRAEDIFNKLTLDPSSDAIYEKLLEKINNNEKVKLVRLIIDHILDQDVIRLSVRFAIYLNSLKHKIGDENLEKFCRELHTEVEQGKEKKILMLFFLFGDNLNLLKKDEKDLILEYVYQLSFGAVSYYHHSRLENYYFQKACGFLGLYINEETLRDQFFTLVCRTVTVHNMFNQSKPTNTDFRFLRIYNALILPLDKGQKAKCVEIIKDRIEDEIFEKFFIDLKNYDDFPF